MRTSIAGGRLLAVLCLAGLVALAGCVGGTPSGDPDGADSADSASGSTDDADAEWDRFAFDEPATYTYDVYLEDEGSGTLVWDVTDVGDDEVTVVVEYDLGGTAYETTVTAAPDDLEGQLLATPAGPFLLLSVLSPTMSYYEGHDLSTGSEWSIDTPEGSVRAAVVGDGRYAGVDCYATEIEVDGTIVHESCLSPERGLAPYVAYYGDDGSRGASMELVDFAAN